MSGTVAFRVLHPLVRPHAIVPAGKVSRLPDHSPSEIEQLVLLKAIIPATAEEAANIGEERAVAPEDIIPVHEARLILINRPMCIGGTNVEPGRIITIHGTTQDEVERWQSLGVVEIVTQKFADEYDLRTRMLLDYQGDAQ